VQASVPSPPHRPHYLTGRIGVSALRRVRRQVPEQPFIQGGNPRDCLHQSNQGSILVLCSIRRVKTFDGLFKPTLATLTFASHIAF
jgi:hypothetical protein